MRIVIQRTSRAKVSVNGNTIGEIGQGMMILVGIEDTDTDEDIDYLCRKITTLRIFNDADGVMNLPITDITEGGILIISQFTLMASTKKGCRPSYINASRPEVAIPIYEKFVQHLGTVYHGKIQTGRFGADMQVELVNDGPVTICIDSKNR